MLTVETVIKFLYNALGGPFALSDLARIVFIIPVMLYASYRDYRDRVIPDSVWLPVLFVGVAALLYDISTGGAAQLLPAAAANIVVAAVVAIALRKQNIFYGADMKAVLVLGIAIPTTPLLGQYPLHAPGTLEAPFNIAGLFIISVLANASLISLLYPASTFVHNIRRGAQEHSSLPWLFVARRVEPDELADTEHGNIVETWEMDLPENPIRRTIELIRAGIGGMNVQFIPEYTEWRTTKGADVSRFSDISRSGTDVMLNHFLREPAGEQWETNTLEEDEKSLEELAGQDHVWLTPGIPFIIPITIGLLTAIFYGDIVYVLIQSLT